MKIWTTTDDRCRPMTVEAILENRAIAVDLDGTLINGPRAAELRRFIRRWHGSRRFVLATHRCTPEHVARIEAELMEPELNFLPMSCFHAVEPFPAPARLTEEGRFPEPLPGTLKEALRSHKALAAARHGATLLIDDDPATSFDACDLFGIAFLHSHDFPPLS